MILVVDDVVVEQFFVINEVYKSLLEASKLLLDWLS